MTGVLIADYFLVRHRELRLGDLYIGNSTSAYWYIAGFNWRAFVAWFVPTLLRLIIISCFVLTKHRGIGFAPLMPGFIRQIRGTSSYSGWDCLFKLSYFFGFGVAFAVHAVLHMAFPTLGQRGNTPFVLNRRGTLAGEVQSRDATPTEESIEVAVDEKV